MAKAIDKSMNCLVIMIAFQDMGMGIDDSDKKHVFQKFYKGYCESCPRLVVFDRLLDHL